MDFVESVRLEPPCGMSIPAVVFDEYVRPDRFLDERPGDWRPMLFARFVERARRAASIADAVATLNRDVFAELGVAYHPTRRTHNHMSPLESIECGFASCTGLSILLAAACRAVGIPVRVVGTPLWRDGSGNHTWVEVWDHGTWHFLGASEPGPYDLCWFNDRARQASVDHPILAARSTPGATHFQLAWDPDNRSIPADDVTDRYRSVAPTPHNATDIVVEPRRYLAQHVARPIELTGRLSDPHWAALPWTEDFVDIEGHRKPTPRFATRAKMCWDDEHFYVAAVLEDPHVWATLTEKNSFVFNDPDFEIFLDPDGDNHNYYEFEINALGTIWELWLERPYRDGGPVHRGWNLDGVRYAVAVDGTLNDPSDTDRGWSVEIAIPFAALRAFAGAAACPPADGDQWRINFSRVHWLADIIGGAYRKVPRDAHPEDNWVWTPQEAVDMHRPEKWGYVEFGREARAPRRDPTRPARELLMEYYYARREARPFAPRGVRDPSLTALEVMEGGPGGWTARVGVAQDSGGVAWVEVDGEGRLRLTRPACGSLRRLSRPE